MRRSHLIQNTIILISCLLVFAISSIPASAQDSLLINYQGQLTDDAGSPLDTTVMIMFNIYDEGGHFLWGEGSSTTVTNGLFNVILGSVVSLSDSIFNGNDRYLGITVGADPEISPRTLLTSVPGAAYSLHASTADTAGYVEGGVGVTQLLTTTSGIELINGYLHFLAIDSIDAPASGFAMCQATVNLYCEHLTESEAGVNIEFMDSSLTHLLDQEHYWFVPASLPTDIFLTTITIHRLFPVNPGYNRFNLIGSDFRDPGNTFFVSRIVMTLTYIPTSYGTVHIVGDTPDGSAQAKKMPLDDQLREELIERSLR